jgi:Helix-hairpin-helix motif
VPTPPVPNGYGWGILPLATFGAATPFSFMYAALKFKSQPLGLAALGYGLGWVAVFGGAWLVNPVLGWVLWVLLWIGGGVHALTIRDDIYPSPLDWYRDRANEHAVAAAKGRQELRRRAREIAAEDPSLAHELRIGRPDLPRTFDDGGLIDVNHAPGPALALLPGLTDALVDRILEIRAERGGFISAEELAVDVELPADLVAQVAEYALFLR